MEHTAIKVEIIVVVESCRYFKEVRASEILFTGA
jgi:hypothetical protein